MNFKKFLLIGAIVLSSHVNAAELQSHKIFSILEQGGTQSAQTIKEEGKSLYQTLFSKLKSAGMTTLDDKSIPVDIQVIDTPKSSMSHLKFTAFADNDEKTNSDNVRIIFNSNGKVAAPVTKETGSFANNNQKIHDGNYLEFTILHELGHLQHDKMGYMHSKTMKSMTIDEKSFINNEKEKDYNRSVDGRHQEQTADMLAAVWHLKNNNFSQESIDTIKSFRDNRKEDLKNIQAKSGKEIISYDTAPGLTFVLNNLDEIKKVNGNQVLDYVSEKSSQLTKDYAQSINNPPTIKPLSSTLANIQNIRNSSLNNQTSNSLKLK
jgi:hypothetical protein